MDNDPDYALKKEIMMEVGSQIANSSIPPGNWLPALKDQYENAIKEMQAKEAYNVAIVKDHLELKHIFELEERAASEENESIRQHN